MIIVTREHGVGFRSRLLERHQAQVRAAQVQLDPRFDGVRVLESRQAKHPTRRFFAVAFPVSEAAQAALKRKLQADRIARAEAEGPQYTWVSDPDHSGLWLLQSASGAAYEITPAGPHCSCPDFEDTADLAGIFCKHLVAYQRRLGTWLPALRTIPEQVAA